MKRLTIAAALCAVLGTTTAAADGRLRVADLADLSLEELSTLRITSIARRETPLSDAAASVFVITAADIRRSGATTLPEILRLAPNLQVARINALDYAITARGFNNNIGNKLLVLVDGRAVYNPVYSGVFWEMQDTMIEDIARIEVISGPGGTMWGTNAVNGVINVITQPAAETRGSLVAAQAGTDERGAAVRHGAALGETGAFRIYARTRDWDRTDPMVPGTAAMDAWRRHQAGFRADFSRGSDRFTLQGDVVRGSSEHRGGALDLPARELTAHHLLGHWTRGNLRVRAYWDYIERQDALTFMPEIKTFDVELQHLLEFGPHRLTWGGGYRRADDRVLIGQQASYVPASRTLSWEHAYAQGDIRMSDAVNATVGLRLERNDYTGLEYLPNLRITWQAAADHFVWAGASRAVRSPSRFDRDLMVPSVGLEGGPGFRSEIARVYEIGVRNRSDHTVHWNLTAFHHHWDRLRGGRMEPPPFIIANVIDGNVRGVEAWARWQVAPRWRITAGALAQDKDLWYRADAGPAPTAIASPTLHNDPDYQLMLRSRFDLGARTELDLALRHVDRLRNPVVPAYTELDVRIGWRYSPALDFALVGRNLLNGSHEEFGPAGVRSEFDRSALAWVTWRF